MESSFRHGGTITGVLVLWFGLSLTLNLMGVIDAEPGRPPLALLLSVVVPPLVFGAAYWSIPTVREVALGIDLRLLTAIQAWRIVGLMFLVLYWFGMLPGAFAWPAGVGDVIVGVYAPFVVVTIARNGSSWRKHALWLNVLGLLDFVGAVGSGVLTGSSLMLQLPLSLIPTFAVPFWIVLHIISLLQLRKMQS